MHGYIVMQYSDLNLVAISHMSIIFMPQKHVAQFTFYFEIYLIIWFALIGFGVAFNLSCRLVRFLLSGEAVIEQLWGMIPLAVDVAYLG